MNVAPVAPSIGIIPIAKVTPQITTVRIQIPAVTENVSSVVAAVKSITPEIATIRARVVSVAAEVVSKRETRSQYRKAQQNQNSLSHIASCPRPLGLCVKTLGSRESCRRRRRIFTTFYPPLTTLYATTATFPISRRISADIATNKLNLLRSAV